MMRSNGFLTISFSISHTKKTFVLSIRLFSLYIVAGFLCVVLMLGLLMVSSSAMGVSLYIQPNPQLSSSEKQVLLNEIERLKKEIETLQKSESQLKHTVDETPSIWPLNGQIHSGFGIRFHPILKKVRFHQGIDITAWNGSPIKVTANGRVSFAGWTKDFGYTIIVTHARGFSTLYGHTSHLLIRQGERVKKGQLIAQVGSTGLSTGAHLHYEVRKWNIPIRPDPFLNLDLFTSR